MEHKPLGPRTKRLRDKNQNKEGVIRSTFNRQKYDCVDNDDKNNLFIQGWDDNNS